MNKVVKPKGFDKAVEKINVLKDDLNTVFFERRDEIDVLLRGLVSEEHVLFLGLPGTAKSDLINQFASGFDFQAFVTLLAKDSKQDQVNGPYDLLELSKGFRVRKTKGYLPEAEIGFVDEIFKCNSAVLNSLLTLMNEKQFDNGCAGRIDVPLQMLIGASNEYPEDTSLDALYDRFLLRRWVNPIFDEDNFRMLVAGLRNDRITTKVTPSVVKTLRQARNKVCISEILDSIVKIKQEFDDKKFYVSDRRWAKAVKIIKSTAVLRGSLKANSKDLLALADVLWNRKEERPALLKMLTHYLGGNIKPALKIVGAIIEEFQEITNLQSDHDHVDVWDLDTCRKRANNTKDVGHLCRMSQMLQEPLDNIKDLAEEDENCEDILDEVQRLFDHVKALTRKKIGL